MKEIIIVFGAKKKYLSDTLQNKNFKISIGFLPLQGNPALLKLWSVYNIVFVAANTILYIVIAVGSFAMGTAVVGAVFIIAAVIYLCK